MSAFNRLVECHQVTVYNVCLRVIGDVQLAEDATQETFFAAYRAIRGFRGEAFRGWLLRIAANRCYDLLRRRRRQAASSLPEDLPIADPARLPEDMVLGSEIIARLERALRELPADQRLCVVLVDVQGLDYQEAAEAMDTNLGTVKSRLSRGRAKLRELLGPEFRLEHGS